jgi:hypothetical protein
VSEVGFAGRMVDAVGRPTRTTHHGQKCLLPADTEALVGLVGWFPPERGLTSATACQGI